MKMAAATGLSLLWLTVLLQWKQITQFVFGLLLIVAYYLAEYEYSIQPAIRSK